MIAPCKDCPERGCGAKHDTCEKYKAFRAAKDAMIQRKAEIRKADETAVEGVMRVTRKNRIRGIRKK